MNSSYLTETLQYTPHILIKSIQSTNLTFTSVFTVCFSIFFLKIASSYYSGRAIYNKKLSQLPVYKGYPILGALPEFITYSLRLKLDELLLKMRVDGDSARYTIPLFQETGITTCDPQLAKAVFTSSNFVRGTYFQTAFTGISKYSLFIIPTNNPENYKVWKKHRKSLQPAFGPSHLKHSFEATNDICNTLFKKTWPETIKQNGTQINIHQHFSCVSADVIGKVAFSYDFEFSKKVSDKNPEVLQVLHDIEIIGGTVAKRPIFQFLWKYYNVRTSDIQDSITRIYSFLDHVIQKKKDFLAVNSNIDKKNMDVLDRLLLEGSGEGDDKSKVFSDAELKDEILGFFFAGHETSANTMTLAVLELCYHPDILLKFRQEVDQVFNDAGSITYENLSNLKYAEKFLKEVQRLHPTVPLNSRICVKDSDVGNTKIYKGEEIMVDIISLHINEKYWVEPLKFLPERWTDEFVPVPGSYMPFGEGITNCIGQKLAWIEMKLTLSLLVQQYDFTLVKDQDLTPVNSITMGLKNGLLLNINQRA